MMLVKSGRSITMGVCSRVGSIFIALSSHEVGVLSLFISITIALLPIINSLVIDIKCVSTL